MLANLMTLTVPLPLFDILAISALTPNSLNIEINLGKSFLDPDGTGSWRRRQEVIDYLKKGYKKGVKERKYGRRWTGTEGIFSSVKGIFGEETRSKRIENQIPYLSRMKKDI